MSDDVTSLGGIQEIINRVRDAALAEAVHDVTTNAAIRSLAYKTYIYRSRKSLVDGHEWKAMHNGIVAELVQHAGLSTDQAKQVVLAVIRGQVKALAINY